MFLAQKESAVTPNPTFRRLSRLVFALLVTFSAAYALPSAQTPAKKVLTVEDYTKWRSINGAEISGDGNWVAYVLQFTNTAPADAKPVLHIVKLDTNQDTEVPNATGAVFSADSQWIAYQVDPTGGGRGGRGGRGAAGAAANPSAGSGQAGGTTPAVNDAQTPASTPAGGGAQGRGAAPATPAPVRYVELRNLSSGTKQSWQDVQTFAFNASSTQLLLRRRPVS